MTIPELLEYIPRVTSKDNLESSLLKDCLIIIEKDYFYIRKNLERYELSRFLYYASLYFDRFAIPTKYYIERDDFGCFKRYLELLKKIESEVKNYVNILSIELDFLHWEIYDLLDQGKSIDIIGYRNLLDDVHKNSIQLDGDKLTEYQKKKENVEAILCGIENDQLFMKMSCSIPIVPLKQRTIIDTTYLNKKIEIIFEPNFLNNSIVNVSQGSIPIKQSSSNWQQGVSNVTIRVFGFIDLLKIDSSLYVEYDSIDNQAHTLYRYIYYLLSEVLWKLKIINTLSNSNWNLEPNDIDGVTCEVESCKTRIEWKYFPFKNVLRIENLKTESQLISIDLTKRINWFQKCLILSKDYLSRGNSNLSIFWLNIGIESFFDQKISEICDQHDLDKNIFNEDYYQKVKVELEKINSQSIYEKIIWPKPIYKFFPVYKKIKLLSKEGLIQCSQKELLSHYHIISKYRNDLFHGSINTLIDVSDAKDAISSYEWILINFK